MTDIAHLAADPHQFNYRAEGPSQSQQWASRYVLFMEAVTCVFDGFKALDLDALGIGHNELRVVVGPNGAGKTTMCDVISGLTRPTTGRVYFAGEDISSLGDTQRAQRGIGRKFQIPNVFDSLTVWENMLLALPNPCLHVGTKEWITERRKYTTSVGIAPIAIIKLRTMLQNMGGRPDSASADRIHAILKRVRLDEFLHVQARNLSHGQRQWLAISKLIIAEPKLLLVDEPAAGLTDRETELTAQLLLELKGSHTIIVIEHDMEFVRRLGSRVTVLDSGRILAEGSLDEISANADVREAYLGR
jgi:urea transport system ATP-binding protein